MSSAVKKIKLDSQIISEIEESVIGVFNQFFGLGITLKESSETKIDHVCQGDVSGVIGIAQEQIEGTLIVSFPQDTITSVLSLVYKKELTTIDDSVRQGVGELTNMIYGQLKKALNERGHALQMAIPNVVIGRQHQVVPFHYGVAKSISFESDKGPFEVTIAVQEI